MKITGICLLLLISLSILLIGCGGGGGGDTASTLDPEQLEVAAVLDSFAAAVRVEDSAAANACLDTNLKYRRVGNITEIGADKFVARLNKFFAGAVVKDFQITEIGIQVADNQAAGRANLSLSWADNSAVDQTPVSENIELVFARTGGVWGILEFGVYSQKGSAFPPEP